jgi:hypothetical protein
MSPPAHFKCNNTGTCIQQFHKMVTHLPVAFIEIVSVPFAPTFHIHVNQAIPHKDIRLLNMVLKTKWIKDEVLHLAQIVSSLSIWLGRYHYNQISSRFSRNRTHVLLKTRQYIERNNTGKLTLAVISECRLCFYWGQSGLKRGVLRKLFMCKVKLRVHTDT